MDFEVAAFDDEPFCRGEFGDAFLLLNTLVASPIHRRRRIVTRDYNSVPLLPDPAAASAAAALIAVGPSPG